MESSLAIQSSKFRCGDLILYRDETKVLKEYFFGIYLTSRTTKWTDEHLFHVILEAGGGVDEFVLRQGNEGKVVVIQSAETQGR